MTGVEANELDRVMAGCLPDGGLSAALAVRYAQGGGLTVKAASAGRFADRFHP
ncbi:hypothetical protein GCM10010385_59100 [Streptomyces geysiriensis]|nr:hypothetical protein GCM10010385_59100 [Streptomyces geysiriensis]